MIWLERFGDGRKRPVREKPANFTYNGSANFVRCQVIVLYGYHSNGNGDALGSQRDDEKIRRVGFLIGEIGLADGKTG